MAAARVRNWIPCLLALCVPSLLGAQGEVEEPPVPMPFDQVEYADKIDVLLIGGANNHDWRWTHGSLAEILEETGRFTVTTCTEPAETLADAEGLAEHDVFLLDYNGPRWGENAERNFVQAVRGGTGVVVVHAADNAFPGWVDYEEMVMLLWREGTGHGRFHTFDVEIVDRDHPVTRDMADMVDHPDELYHRLVNPQGVDARVLAHAFSSKESGGTGTHEPMVLVRHYGKGRVFHTPLGHVWRNVPSSRASHLDPQFRRLIARGTEWAATGEVTLAPTPPNWVSPEERALGFRRLFDGSSTDGWRGYRQQSFPEQGWSVERGALVHAPDGGGGDLVTTEQYGDFELRFQWATAPKANSGVIYRVAETQPQSYMTGPEFQVLDDHGLEVAADSPTSAGALYGLVAPEDKAVGPADTWNDGRIVVRGWRVEHWVNDIKVLDVDLAAEGMQQRIEDSKFADWPFATQERGHIALQDHGDEVRYRSLRIRPLDEPGHAEEAAADKDGDGR